MPLANSSPARSTPHGCHGFTLLELAIALMIIGLLAGGGLAIVTSISHQGKREETARYLEAVRQSLLVYANINGRLPRGDSGGDGLEEAAGTSYANLAYKTLGVGPQDAWGRRLKYAVNGLLVTNKATSCAELKTMITNTATAANWPKVWDASGAAASNPLPYGVVVVSAGPKDADGNGSVYDGSYDSGPPASGGDNQTGDPYTGVPFLRRPPEYSGSVGFDDLVIYIGAPTLYDWMKCTN